MKKPTYRELKAETEKAAKLLRNFADRGAQAMRNTLPTLSKTGETSAVLAQIMYYSVSNKILENRLQKRRTEKQAEQ